MTKLCDGKMINEWMPVKMLQIAAEVVFLQI